MRRCLLILEVYFIILVLLLIDFSILYAQQMPSPCQYGTLLEYQKSTGKKITAFKESPQLTELVKQKNFLQ